MSRPIKQQSSRPGAGDSAARSLGASYRPYAEQSVATIAEESIARDIEEEDSHRQQPDDSQPLSRSVSQDRPPYSHHSMAGRHRRPSYTASGPRPFLGTQLPESIIPYEQERDAAISEERSLLRDNNIIPPKHPRRASSQASGLSTKASDRRTSSPGFARKKSVPVEEETQDGADQPTETTALLANGHRVPARDPEAAYGGEDSPENIDAKWEEAVLAGKIHTTWQRETKVLARYSAPLIFTFILQNSLTLTSIFTVGHIGKIELGAVSLGGMTANITGYAVYHGLATSLDTLCAQAYGSGRKELVGLQLQRMVFFLWAITVPIAAVWLAGTQILKIIVPEQEIAILAGYYLKILILGAPGYALFESAKRYVQAQGMFAATMYVLLIAAPLNMFLHWLFVWHFQWGYIGAPIAIVIVENLMPLLLFLYVRFINPAGMACWPGFSRAAFKNWGPMIRLALPGFIMVMAEFLAFEILTLASARISSTHLAAQTVLQSLSVLTYQLPFPLAIAASTRVANLIGAGLPDPAKTTAKVTYVGGTAVGLFNAVMLLALRKYIPHLFSNDMDVIRLATQTLPVNAAFQLFDALAAQSNGLLRGLGKQSIGGYVSLFAYYGIAMPISFGTGFGLHWDLYGLWAGPAIALLLVSSIQTVYICYTDWGRAAEEAAKRNAAG